MVLHVNQVIQMKNIGVVPKWNGNSVNSANSGNGINHCIKYCGQCLVSCMSTSWSFTQEVAGSNNHNNHFYGCFVRHLEETQLIYLIYKIWTLKKTMIVTTRL